MKKSILFASGLFLFMSCGEPSSEEFISEEMLDEIILLEKVNVIDNNSNSEFVSELLVNITEINKGSMSLAAELQGKEVDLYSEFLSLFDPDNFDCGCKDKLKRRLSKIKAKDRDGQNGFIPNVVTKNAYYKEKVVLLSRGGGNVLAHLFRFDMSDGTVSKPVFAGSAPTVDSFNDADYIERRKSTHDNFFYTMDCSGYLSAAVAVATNVGRRDIKGSAESSADKKKSLMVIGGVMYSVLYQAYEGTFKFQAADKKTLARRKAVLEAILQEIPTEQQVDSARIYLNKNYQVILTSNSGTTSFNGEADFSLNGSAKFGPVSASGSAGGRASIQRGSSFSNYNTYVSEKNINAVVGIITVKDLKDLITSLTNRISGAPVAVNPPS